MTATLSTKAFAAKSATEALEPFTIERREPQENDVLLDIKFCGICHSDLHQARNEWEEQHISDGARSRNCGSRQIGRLQRQELQGWRLSRNWLLCELMPQVRTLQKR